MKVMLKDELIVLIPESDEEAAELAEWKGYHEDHVLAVRPQPEQTAHSLELHDLGHRLEACREPLNVVSSSPDPRCRTISNLASTPFELDGQRFQSTESFWQGLKFPLDSDRRRIAKLPGAQALSEGSKQGYGKTITHGGEEIAVGTWQHWALMDRACRAKFQQSDEARTALLATGDRPLVHIVRHDSKAIPGVIMAQIWMRIRSEIKESPTV
jgi:predicted NAD-dependent protein-ADP-ribosyltransferase YbiA (DUF1768 family)